MSGIVKIVGRKEPLHISSDKVAKLQKMVIEKDEKDIVQIEYSGGVWTGRISDIRSVERAENKSDDVWERRKSEEQEEYKRYSRMTPQARAQYVGKFKLWWGIHYGERIAQDPPQELIYKAIKAQEKWYEDNPKVIYPNRCPSSVFESIIPNDAKLKPKEIVKSMPDVSELAQTSENAQNGVSGRNTPQKPSEANTDPFSGAIPDDEVEKIVDSVDL